MRLLLSRGLSAQQAADRLWLIDRQGLIHDGLEGVHGALSPYSKRAEQLVGWSWDGQGPIDLLTVVQSLAPTVLIGTSTCAGAFDQAVIEALCRSCERPIVLPLSNPTRLAEVTPQNLLAWSGGRALVATGSPFEAVEVGGRLREIGQCNNCFVFPGLGFAAVAVGAAQVSEAMIDACIEALAAEIPAACDADAALMVRLDQVQEVSNAVARAVALAAVAEGLARRATTAAEALQCLEAASWQPVYREITAV
jgi:malate dehydrogenase (oxaloacetate-decarboxylating)